MSDNSNIPASAPPSAPRSIGEALYGPNGPSLTPVGPTPGMIDGGRPAAPVPQQPVESRTAPPGARQGAQPASEEKSPLAAALYGKSAETRGDAPFDPANLKIDGFEADPALMTEFAGAGLDESRAAGGHQHMRGY